MRIRKEAYTLLVVCLLFPSLPQQSSKVALLNQEFQAAVSDYQHHRFGQAQRILTSLLQQAPENFELNELMGLVYRGQGDAAHAAGYLAKAVALKPDSAEARMYWASSLLDLHQNSRAGRQFEKAVQLQPAGYDPNHNLAEFYLAEGKIAAAVPYLQKAQQARPSSMANGHDLALAQLETGRPEEAKATLKRLMALKPSPDLIALLAGVDEKTGQPVEAAKEYQLAARMDPSEANMFAWGSELLLHHALDAAEQVFERGARLYPRSRRLQIGLGIALYSRSRYGDAVDAVSKAIALDPEDPRPFGMLNMIYDISPPQAPRVTESLARFAQLEPRNPNALYYYALCLWKRSRANGNHEDSEKAEALLKTVTTLDPGLADAHLQLGIIYWQQQRVADAIEQYRRAVEDQPSLTEAHYRLAAALVRAGKRAQAQREYAIYSRLRAVQTKEKRKKRASIQDFESVLASPSE